MDEARCILQHQRQSEPQYAALPTIFGRPESAAQTHAQILQLGIQARTDAIEFQLGASATQVCSASPAFLQASLHLDQHHLAFQASA